MRADNLRVRGLRQLSSGICRSTFRQRARTIRSVRAQLPGNRYRSTPSLHHPHSYPAMPTALLQLRVLARRRLQPLGPNFLSRYRYTRHWPFLERTSSFLKGMNGRSTGRLPLRRFQRYAALRPPFGATFGAFPPKAERVYREIINWCGTRPSGLWSICSTMCGATNPKLLWITVWISPFQYASNESDLPLSQHRHQIALFVIGVAGSFCPVPTLVVS